ncbi:MAG: hypothetical protein KatS3mg111_3344 [Pirellulaceae bacterium]|nr:MAG: hypothetical protein KatS3mg111_3344 [Pirellulaceae bacterium]
MIRTVAASAVLRTSCLVLVLLAAGRLAKGESPLQYNRDIRPILAEYCFACHGVDSAARQADLRLDDRAAAMDMGAIVPGDPESSEMMARILADDPDLVMPPTETKKTLSEEEKETLRRWIAEGAEYEKHWSLLAPQKPSLPQVSHPEWVKTPIDHFVLHQLEARGLEPAPEADPATLLRRLHLDITGLPPRYEDVRRFVTEYSQRGDEALSEWIDRLMMDPGWGEHRARYWLDAARYGDTHGLHFDNYREMWPYRDWVIRAFNRNQPFDQFIVEQIAGDMLPDPTDDQLIATGFQRCNITTNEGGTIDEENLANYAADRVQTFGWVFLGMTTNCAQCHDHKFDPFTMRDYYSLAAFFRNTTQGPKDGNVKDGLGPILVVPYEEDRPRWKALPGEIAAAQQARDQCRRTAEPEYQQWLTTFTPQQLEEAIPRDQLQAHLPLNEGAGDQVADRAIGSSSPTATGNLHWAPDDLFGTAVVIDAGKTVQLGDVGDFEQDESFSYGAWYRPPDKRTSGGIIARMDEKNNHRGWDLWQNGDRYSVHLIDRWSDNALKVSTKKATVQAGKWQHVFVTYDGSGQPGGIKIYVDGQPEELRTDTDTLKKDASIRTATPTRIGQRSHGAVVSGSRIRDVRIYGRQLSESEVASIAMAVPLQAALAIPEAERTEEQRQQLFEYYLHHHHPSYPTLARRVQELEAEQEAIRARSPITHIQQEKPNSEPVAHILIRGQYDQPGELVHAATPAALHPLPEGVPANRLGLAYWLVDPANPLTARVTVNRFWQEVFGLGIVATPEDFGVMGALPSNQELLDWLAVDFREHGWDVKRLFKLMLMSATYRQAAIATPRKLELDPHNELLSRGPRFRMDAEMIRDYALAVSGVVVVPPVRTKRQTVPTGEHLGRRRVAGRQYPELCSGPWGKPVPSQCVYVLETDGPATEHGSVQCPQPRGMHGSPRAHQHAAASFGNAQRSAIRRSGTEVG